MAGDEYSIADIITWPWAFLIRRVVDENAWETFPNVRRWVYQVGDRPAVDKGRRIGHDLGQRKLTEEEEKARQELLFNQTNEKVRAAREIAAQAAS